MTADVKTKQKVTAGDAADDVFSGWEHWEGVPEALEELERYRSGGSESNAVAESNARVQTNDKASERVQNLTSLEDKMYKMFLMTNHFS